MTMPVAVLAVGLALVVLAVVVGSDAAPAAVPGLPDPGALTHWGLPLSRVVGELAAVGAVGWLLAAAVLLPAKNGRLGGGARRCGRQAAAAAAVWAVATVAELVFTASDITARPAADILDAEALRSFVGATSQGKALVVVALGALVVAIVAGTLMSTRAAGWLLAAAVGALLPPVLVGHASGSSQHALAVVALGVHVLGATVWAGGLLALVGLGRARGGPASSFPPALRRYSRLAAPAAAAVAVGGVASAALRLGGFGPLFTDRYGLLVLGKIAGLAAAVTLGGIIRRRLVVKAEAASDTDGAGAGAAIPPRRVFTRLAAVEISMLAATFGLATGLSRTAPPVDESVVPTDPTEALLGYPMPAPITAARLVTDWRIDWVFLGGIALAAGLYLAGVWRLARRGDTWPVGRTLSWLTGLLVVLLVTSSGLGRYGPVLLSAHMTQHMFLSMLAPIPLVLGAPITLALRAMRPAVAPYRTGPREWLLAVLRSPVARVLTHPLFVTANFAGSLYVIYLSPLLDTLMNDHLGHLFMNVHFLLAGFAFFEVIIGIDPIQKRPPHPGRVLVLAAVVPFHAFFGLTVMSTTTVLGSGWYDQLVRPWGASSLDDQGTAGGITWAFGEIPTLIVLLVLVVQWARTDERRARNRERRVDAAGVDEQLAAYNAYLARLNGERPQPASVAASAPASTRASAQVSTENISEGRHQAKNGPVQASRSDAETEAKAGAADAQ